MASLQTNAVLSSPNTANAAMKASLQPAGSDNSDFATMLNDEAPKPFEKAEAPQKPADVKAATPAPRAKAKTDNKTADKADKPEHKSAAKAKDASDAKADPAKPATTTPPQQTADAADDDSDTADNNADAQAEAQVQTAANQNNDPAAAQAPQAQPAQPDASAQAQQMLAAAAPTTAAQSAPTTANDNNTVTGPSAKSGRPQQQRTPAPQDTAASPATDASAATAKAAPGTVPDFLKAAGHQDGKIQSADAAKSDPAQPVAASQTTPQPVTPAPPPTPASTLAANAAGVTASTPAANIMSTGANAGVATSLHVAPQDPTPNVNSLAVEIAARSQSGAKEFQIRLDPPELGHVEVRLSIDASGKAEAHMTADQQQTLDLLQKNSPTLTSALRDAGLDVSQSGLNFSLRGQDRQGGDNQGGAQTRGASTSLAATKTIDAVQSANPYLSSAGDARLDIHV